MLPAWKEGENMVNWIYLFLNFNASLQCTCTCVTNITELFMIEHGS